MDTGIAILIGLAVFYVIIRFLFRTPVKRGAKVTFADTAVTPFVPPAAPQNILEREPKKETNFLHSVTVAVYIPLLLSVVSGVICSLLALIVMKIKYSWSDSFIAAGITFLVVTGLIWTWRFIDWHMLIHQVETVTHIDLDGDGVRGEPIQPQPIVIHHYDGNQNYSGSRRAYISLTVSEGAALAQAVVMDGRAFSEPSLARGDKKIFSQRRFAEIQDELVRADLVAHKGSGYEFNRDGLDYLNHFLPSPTVESASFSVPVR
jgi:hypothetical protein